MLANRKNESLPPRRGFTLVELLIVITLIAFLIAITVTAYGNYVQTARLKASRTIIGKVAGALEDRLRAFDIAFEPNRQNSFKAEIAVLDAQLGAGDDLELARIIIRKQKLKEFFPQRFAELDATQVANNGLTIPAGGDETESAEVLYYMLTRSDVLGVPPVGDDNFLASEIADTDNDGWPEFVDSWQRPLRFYRWPTRLIRDGGVGDDPDLPPDDDPHPDFDRFTLLVHDVPSDMLTRDPHDPLGVFSTYSATLTDPELTYHTPDTYYSFLIVSAGPDGELGLFEPYDESNYGILGQPLSGDPLTDPLNSTLNDNLTNLQRN